ncbi:acetolactate decarboxylase [Coxiella endosymbiont of Ornithodoros amblus]|nr:acetolactate decarboxylase [Coxiella endosymbiont of Ornithodoros amblus]
MIAEGKVFVANKNGDARKLPKSTKTPFSEVVKFYPTQIFKNVSVFSMSELEKYVTN